MVPGQLGRASLAASTRRLWPQFALLLVLIIAALLLAAARVSLQFEIKIPAFRNDTISSSLHDLQPYVRVFSTQLQAFDWFLPTLTCQGWHCDEDVVCKCAWKIKILMRMKGEDLR